MADTQKRKIVVTGLNGVIGRAIRSLLEERYEVMALSRSGVDGLPRQNIYKADISDLKAIQPAFAGIDTVVHLAGAGGASSQFADDQIPWESILRTNIIGTYNVFEAARHANVRRIIFASSGATVIGYEEDFPYSELIDATSPEIPDSWPLVTQESEPKPRSLYGVSKLFGEDLARYYVGISQMSIICLRIGLVLESNIPKPGRGMSIWCSHKDITQMVYKCIEAADSLRFDIFYVTSKNTRGYRDLEHARKVVGFYPTEGI